MAENLHFQPCRKCVAAVLFKRSHCGTAPKQTLGRRGRAAAKTVGRAQLKLQLFILCPLAYNITRAVLYFKIYFTYIFAYHA